MRLDGHALGLHVGVGPKIERRVRGQQDRFEQGSDVDALLRRDVDEHGVAAVLLGDQPVLGELLADLLRVRTLLVDLVHRDHDRHLGRLRVVDRFHRLRHDAVVGGDHDHRDVRGLRTTSTHGGERLVTRGVDEGDQALVVLELRADLVSADVLGDATGLALVHVRLTDRVEQARLTVVDVTHDGHDRRPCLEVDLLARVLTEGDVERVEQLAVLLLGADHLHDVVHLRAEELEHLVGHGLRRGDHLAEVEQHLHQRSRVGVDLVGEVGQRGAAGEANGLAAALGEADAADRRRLHVLHVLLALLALGLASALARPAGTPEGTRRTAASAAATGTATAATETAATCRGTATATGTETATGTAAAATGATAEATATAAATGTAAETAATATGAATSAATGPATRTARRAATAAAGRPRGPGRHHAGVGPRGHVARVRARTGRSRTATRTARGATLTGTSGALATRRTRATGARTCRTGGRSAAADAERVVADPRRARTGLGRLGPRRDHGATLRRLVFLLLLFLHLLRGGRGGLDLGGRGLLHRLRLGLRGRLGAGTRTGRARLGGRLALGRGLTAVRARSPSWPRARAWSPRARAAEPLGPG